MSKKIKDRPICAGTTSDGDSCQNPAKREMTFDGVSYCGVHGKKIIERQDQYYHDLARYRAYQEVAFGATVASRCLVDLQERLSSIKSEDRSNASDLHSVRLEAEAAAITRELARRKGVTT